MWQQETQKPQISQNENVIMWSNRGSTKLVSSKRVDDLIAKGWVLAAPGTEVGLYNPIYDKGDNIINEAIMPQHVQERNITDDYLEVIEL